MANNNDWMGRKIVELELRVKFLETKEDDKEVRLRKIEQKIWIAAGAVMAFQLALKLLPFIKP